MAEFCLECFNKINGTHPDEMGAVLEDNFCEGCGRPTPCVVAIRRRCAALKGQALLWRRMHREKDKR